MLVGTGQSDRIAHLAGLDQNHAVGASNQVERTAGRARAADGDHRSAAMPDSAGQRLKCIAKRGQVEPPHRCGPAERQQQMRARPLLDQRRFGRGRHWRRVKAVHRQRQSKHIFAIRNRILAGGDDQVEQPVGRARMAQTDDPGAAVVLALDPARHGDRSAADSDHQIGPRRLEPGAAVRGDMPQADREQLHPQPRQHMIMDGPRFERDAQGLTQSKQLIIVAAPSAQKQPDARAAHAFRTRRYSPNTSISMIARLTAVASTSATAAPTTP